MAEGLRFTVLGPVRAWRGAEEVPLGTPQQRAVLAVLLVRQGSQVPVEELVDAVWGEEIPSSATSSVRTYVHRLRRMLEQATAADPVIRSVGSGYMMHTAPDRLDLASFRERLADAERARRDDDPKRAAELLREALELWHGSALAGIPGPWAEAQRNHLARLRLSAVEARLTVELDLGGHQEAAAELTSLVAEHPLDERFREMLMLALYRSGRQASALEVYRDSRTLLAEELGVEPGPALRALHERILRADDTLLHPPRAAARPAPAPGAPAPRHGGHRDAPPDVRQDAPRGAGQDVPSAANQDVSHDVSQDLSHDGGHDAGHDGGHDAGHGAGFGDARRNARRNAPPDRRQDPDDRPDRQDPGQRQGPGRRQAPHRHQRDGDPWPDPAPEPRPGLVPAVPDRRSAAPAVPAAPAPPAATAPAGVPARIPVPREAPEAAVPLAVPAQLPHGLAAFTGREAETARLEARFPVADEPRTAGVICTVTGTAGVGKTAFAVHCAHRVAPRFPDGQVYLNLRGFDSPGPPVSTTRALGSALEALGVPAEKQPRDVDAQAALYRSLLAGRRVLLLLDNARDSDQVRPLLPGAPGCGVIVTSRNQLSGLIVKDGAHHLRLEVLTAGEARDVLARRIGAARVAAEPEAAEEIVERSARLPLALALVAARAATRADFPLAAVADELRDLPGRLDALSDTDGTLDVRSVFSWSYHALSDGAARLFRLFAAHPGPDLTLPAAASLLGLPAARARRLLAELAGAHLVDEHVLGRYAPHDLLRVYAAELLAEDEPEEECRAATHRMLSYYLHSAAAGARLLTPQLSEIALVPAPPGSLAERFDRSEESWEERTRAWFTAELVVLLGAVGHAARTGFETHAWQLAWALMELLQRYGRWDDNAAIQRTALEAARRSGDRTGQSHAQRNLALARITQGRYEEAEPHLEQALALCEELGDLDGQGRVHNYIASVSLRQGDNRRGLRHTRTALDLFRASGDRYTVAMAANNVGWAYAMLGEYEPALEHCWESLTMLRGLGDRTAEAAAWDSLGYIRHHLGQYDEAIDAYGRALALDREIDDRFNESDTLSHLGDTHLATGDRDAARLAWRAALAGFTELDPEAAERVRGKLRDLDVPPDRDGGPEGPRG
ncbi:AfsR/SARP family transcriptional regulator [Streptomyces lycii]|uniref:Tetratricopeptide repeat protein n=1 Tax=Streptomyces lycii TaxID=2654337 RepID=A0ABQ7FGF9_9ACTN|nr:BTAD domain-containing putative transcriptional regulator [Streptomyces lycii]KAF4408086.1 tetratricopeptide repeat protein [Streptomyces lycii]